MLLTSSVMFGVIIRGYTIHSAEGNSMCDIYSNKSIALLKEINDKNLTIGKVYVYEKNNILVRHRLVDIVEFNYGNTTTETFYEFKGDNNNIADDYIKREVIKYKLVFNINLEEC